MKEVPAFLLITWTNTWTHFKNLKVRLGRPTNWMQRSDHSTSLNRGLSRKSELKRYCLLNNNHGLEGCIRDPGFDRNIFNLRYGEKYDVPISVPLNQDSHSLVSSLFLRSQTKKSEQEKEARESRESREREREETLPSPSSFLAVGKEGKKRGQIGNISASEGSRAVPIFPPQTSFSPTPIFSPFSHNAEPGPRIQKCCSGLGLMYLSF